MKKIQYLHIFLLGLLSVAFFSCSKPTIEEDARKAVDLSMESIQYSKDNDMSTAGKKYEDAMEIMDKYKELDKFDEFYQLYISYMHEESYKLDGEIPTSSDN